MRLFILNLILMVFISCDKIIDVKLPAYESELVMEMYLEEGKPLRCLLIESLPYTDTAINKPVNNALVILSDGIRNDTLTYKVNQDKVTGRHYNYYNPKLIEADSGKTYSILIIGENKKISGITRFDQRITNIDRFIVKESKNKADSFRVGIIISDPADQENYYRFLVGKTIHFFGSDPTDFSVSDVSFNGKSFSFFSGVDFGRKDTVAIRIYSLHRDHFKYLESIGNARRSNFNPFTQPSRIKSNVSGGLGIFTTIRYIEKKIIIN